MLKTKCGFALTCGAALLVSILAATQQAAGDVQFFTDEATWASAVAGLPQEDFTFSASGLALADEVSSPPDGGDDLGQILTFGSAATGLSLDFTFENESADPGTFIRFVSPPFDPPPFVGLGVSPTFDHSWSVGLGAGTPIVAAGLNMFGTANPTDTIRVFDTSNTEIGAFSGLPSDPDFFLGVISDVPIGRILQDNAPISGGIVLSKIAFVPEPSTAFLVYGVLGAMALRRSRTRR